MKKFAVISWVVFLCFVWEVGCYLTLRFVCSNKGLCYEPLVSDSISDDHKEAILRLIEGRTTYTMYDKVLGWKIKPGGAHDLYKANAQGLRGDREYLVSEGIKKGRIATFGDSLTHGDEVNNASTWQAQLEASDSNYEVMNFGVGGFGPDQAYLRYLTEGKQYQPEVVMIGFTPAHNAQRTLNVYRPFFHSGTKQALSKPRYRIEENALVLLPNPLTSLEEYRELLSHPREVLRRIGESDWFYQSRYEAGRIDFVPSIRLVKIVQYEFRKKEQFGCREDTEAFHLSMQILNAFYHEVESEHSNPIIVLYPMQRDLVDIGSGKCSPFKFWLEALKASQMRVIDVARVFESIDSADGYQGLFMPDGHYIPQVNGFVAKYIKQQLDAYSEVREELVPVSTADRALALK